MLRKYFILMVQKQNSKDMRKGGNQIFTFLINNTGDKNDQHSKFRQCNLQQMESGIISPLLLRVSLTPIVS